MHLNEALEELCLNPLDDQIFCQIHQFLQTSPLKENRLKDLTAYFDRLAAGHESFTDFSDRIEPFLKHDYSDILIQTDAADRRVIANIDINHDLIEPHLVKIFLDEATEHLEAITSTILRQNPQSLTQGDWEKIYRHTHTLKGAAASIGLGQMAYVLHHFEDLLSLQRKNHHLLAEQAQAMRLFAMLLQRSFHNVRHHHPIPADLLLGILDQALAAEPISPTLHQQAQTFLGKPLTPPDEHLRVPFSRLNAIYSDLEMLQKTIAETIIVFEQTIASEQYRSKESRRLNDLFQEEKHLISKIKKDMITLRLVPFRSIFPRMQRVIDEYQKSHGKIVRSEFSGGRIDLKKAIIDRVNDLTLHLIRNALDHGIESPLQRQSVNKNPEGTIRIDAHMLPASIRISVQDDGRGIDREKVKESILKKNLATQQDLDNIEDQQLFSYLTLPGFSTRDDSTATSGRGVGLDVVKASADELGGSLTIRSTIGKGTTVEVDLPMDVMVEDIVLLSCGTTETSFLLSDIEAIVGLDDHERVELGNYPYYETSDAVLPVYNLHSLLFGSNNTEKCQSLILFHLRKKRFCFSVDHVLDKAQVISTPLPPIMRSYRHIAKLFAQSDGRLCSILQPLALLNDAHATEAKSA